MASGLLAIIIPANVPMGLGMALSGVLRACGDARRAMYVTLSGGIITAFTDPAADLRPRPRRLWRGLGDADLAAGVSRGRLSRRGAGAQSRRAAELRRARATISGRSLAIGLPSIMANLATPVSAIYVTRVWSDFGEATVAGGAIVDRVIPLAFGVIFALTGSIGPIIGQNFGARLMPRVRRALTDSFMLAVGYALVAWAALALAAPLVVAGFRRERRQRALRAAVLPLRRAGLGVHHLPVRRQHRVQQSRLRADGDAVQLGPRDARHDSVRDHRRALRRRAGGDGRADRSARRSSGSASVAVGLCAGRRVSPAAPKAG